MSDVAIVGCGIIGITTALAIQKKNPSIAISIFTKDVSPHTTSDVAAGLWKPVFVGDTSEENILRWSSVTYNRLLELWKEGKAQQYGINLQPALYFTDNPNFTSLKWTECALGFQMLPESVLNDMSRKYGLRLSSGFIFLTFIWEAVIALPRLQMEFVRNGGKIILKTIDNLNELSKFDVIVNCSGLEARELVGDQTMIPLRGQITKIRAPWQFQTKLVESTTKLGYVIPGIHQCTLGGTATESMSEIVDDVDEENIRRNCYDISPALSTAKTLRHVVGIRPGRNKVRLEMEMIKEGNKLLKIVHNYGHGGAGITLSLGCAKEAADLVMTLLSKHKL